MDTYLNSSWEEFEVWIRRSIGSAFRWKIRPRDNPSNRKMIAGLFRQHLIPVCLGMILLSGMLLMGKECPAETDPCVVKDREEIYDTIERPKDDMDDFYPGWREKADWIRPYFFDFQEPSHMPTQFGVFRLDPRAPKIDGLYFAGETVNSTGATMSGASDTAMICTREILGTDEL